MASLRLRGEMWWVYFRHPKTGKRVARSTGKTNRLEAERVKRAIEREEQLRRDGSLPASVLTKDFAERWLKQREARGVATVGDERTRLFRHAGEVLAMPIREVRAHHIAQVLADMRAQDKHAPRTVRRVYQALVTMFRSAQRHGDVDASPCVLEAHDLPPNEDQDPEWRQQARFSREEVRALVTDSRIPVDRRVLNALLGLGALRFGEASALRLRNYEPDMKPLGKLVVAHSFSRRLRKVKSTKTNRVRSMPVLPELARILEDWLAQGWAEMMDREPTPDDLLLPTREGGHRDAASSLRRFHEDCKRLGIRKRRQHDLRRTFISIARGDGARGDILRWATHSPPRDKIIEGYTSLEWADLCREVSCFRLLTVGVQKEASAVNTSGNALHETGIEGVSAPRSLVDVVSKEAKSRASTAVSDSSSRPDCQQVSTDAEDDPGGHLSRARRAGFRVLAPMGPSHLRGRKS